MDLKEKLTFEELVILYGIKQAQKTCHETAVYRGWYNIREDCTVEPRNFGEVVALMHSELSEALEADRTSAKDDKLPHRDGREVEFADLIIRVLDTAEALNLDVAGALIEKNKYNATREDHSLEARNSEHGKKY